MGMEYIPGAIRKSTLDGGIRESNMDSEYSYQEKEPSASLAFGKTARRSDGSTPRQRLRLLRVAR